MQRLTKDEYFLTLSNVVATRATCDRLWAGCVLVLDGEIVSTGYNGAPPDLPECDRVGHLMIKGGDGKPHCRRAVHAEMNALFQAKNKCKNLFGATAYINATPCEICLSELLKWGVRRIVCGAVYPPADKNDLITEHVSSWCASIEYRSMPDITLVFNEQVSDAKRVQVVRNSSGE